MNAIEFNNISKKFKKGEQFDSLRDLIPNLVKTFIKGNGKNGELHEKEFWALKDVSFSVKKGEVLGIIGSNGAGKSTILKLLSGILKPTSGKLKINGRLSALIEVGAGFHEDLTGRENIYLNGAIMGMKKWEIDKKFDAIVAFSEIEEFIDTPVKRYSSGMYARLGFSVAAHLDPDILLVDEVLSVGDICFQSKCLEKIKELKNSGTTIVFISHNMEAVIDICTRVILLRKGVVVLEGAADDVVKQYQENAMQRSPALQGGAPPGDISIKNVFFLDSAGKERMSFKSGESIIARFIIEARKPIDNPVIGLSFYDSKGVCIYGHNSKIDKYVLGTISGVVTIDIEYRDMLIQPESYFVTVGVFDSLGVEPYDYQDRHYGFSIQGNRDELGLIKIPHSWKMHEHITKVEVAKSGKFK